MEFEGTISLTPLLHVLPGAQPRASAYSSINVPGAVPGLCWPREAAVQQETHCSDSPAQPAFLHLGRTLPQEHCSPAPHTDPDAASPLRRDHRP